MANSASPAPDSSEKKTLPAKPTDGTAKLPEPNAKPGAAAQKAKGKLTPEEQMALYEEALKEEDWGHQPC